MLGLSLFTKARARQTTVRVTDSEYAYATVSVSDGVQNRRAYKFSLAELIARAESTIDQCVQFNASNATSVPIRLYRSAKRGRGNLSRQRRRMLSRADVAGTRALQYAEASDDIEEVTDHAIWDLLRRPNRWMGGTYYAHLGYVHRLLCGTSFEVFDRGRSTIGALYPLYPAYVTIQPDNRDLVAGVWYFRNQRGEKFYTMDELNVYQHSPGLDQPYLGRCPLHGVTLEGDVGAAVLVEAQAKVMNNSRPDHAWVAAPETPRDEIKALEAQLIKFRGPQNAGKPLVTAGIKPEVLSWSPKEMEWKELASTLDRKIRNAYGVPETITGLSDANLASGKMGLRQYLETTIQPMLIMHAEQLTEKLLPLFGIEPGEMFFAPDNASPEDAERQGRVLVSLVGSKILTPNEARQELGYEPREGGDEFDTPTPPGFTIEPRKPGERPADEVPKEDDGGEAEADDNVEAKSIAAPSVVVKRLGWHFTGCDHKGLGTEEAIKRTPEYSQLMRIMADFYGVEYPALAEAYGTGNGAAARTAAEAALRVQIEPVMRSLFERGLVGVVAEAGIEANPRLTDNALAALDNYTLRLTDEITRTMEREIKDAIAQGISQGMSGSEVARVIQAQIGDSVGWRAERVARSETARAQEYGRLTGLQDAGVERKRWLLSNAPCQFCEAAHAKVLAEFPDGVPLNQPFIKLGTVVTGTAGGTMVVTYMDVQAPTDLHPQCACSVTGVWKS